VSSSVVLWNGQPLPTTYLSTTSLHASVSLALIHVGQNANITVSNPAPGGGTTGPKQVPEGNYAPALSGVTPDAFVLGQSAATLTVSGTGFVSSSKVYWDGTPLATTYVSSTSLKAVAPASLFATSTLSTPQVTVVSPAPGGGSSNQVAMSESNPTPALSGVTPNAFVLGQSGATLTLSGTGFVSGSKVYWDGTALTTTYVSSTSLSAAAPASLFATTTLSTPKVTVVNPVPGGGTSSQVAMSESNPAPTASSVSPNALLTGQGDTTLTVTGSGFMPTSKVDWNGSALSTTYVSSTSLKGLLPAASLTGTPPNPSSVTVVTPAPGGGTTSSLSVSVTASIPTPTMTGISKIGFTVGQGDDLLSVTGTGFTTASQVYWGDIALPTEYVSATSLK